MSRFPYGMEHGDVVGSMLAMENGIWYATCSYNKRSNHKDNCQRGNHAGIYLDGSHLLLHHPNDVFGDEISHERIAWQQIDAALALRDAVEEEHQKKGEPGEHLQRSSLLRILQESGLRELLPWQDEEREQ